MFFSTHHHQSSLSNNKTSKAKKRLTKTKISTPVQTTQSLELPKRIIKALYDYKAKGPHEISFQKGDFFHVTGRENDLDWYEACNPASNLKGIVPVPYFQVIERNENKNILLSPTSTTTQQKKGTRPSSSSSSTTGSSSLHSELDSGFSDMSTNAQSPFINKRKHFYGVVMYDFKAERPDELEAQAGEAIVVIAQSNHEWFIAKPIGRLGGPGLIPVSFVQVRDAQTGELITMDTQQHSRSNSHCSRSSQQQQQQQSQHQQRYSYHSSNSIPSSMPPSATTPVTANTITVTVPDQLSADDAKDAQHQPPPRRRSTLSLAAYSSLSTELSKHNVIFASVDSYILEGDQYWFVVYARVHQHCHRILYRLYEDFYDFQMNLLNQFPVEAGRTGDSDRILPFMPGPLTYVDDKLTAERQVDLNRYCQELLRLPKHISECELVQKFLFGVHEGDIELDYDPRLIHQHCFEMDETAQEVLNIAQPNQIASVPSVATPVDVTTMAATPASAATATVEKSNSVAETEFEVAATLEKMTSPTTTISMPLPAKPDTTAELITASHTTTNVQQQQQQKIKIKIIYKDDMFAIKVPIECSLEHLKEKVLDRIGPLPTSLQLEYKSEATGSNEPLISALDMEEAFVQAVQRSKLTVIASTD